MSLRDFLLIQTGQLIMPTGCGYHAPHSFTRYVKILELFLQTHADICEFSNKIQFKNLKITNKELSRSVLQ